MLVEIITKVLHHDQLGTLRQGEKHDLPEAQAREFASKGWVMAYVTKVVVSEPYEDKSAAPRRRRKAEE